MNRIVILIIAVFFSTSCASIKPEPKEGGFSTFLIDFTEYAESDFLFTPYAPDGEDYLGLGEVRITLEPEIIELTFEEYTLANDVNAGIYPKGGKSYDVKRVFSGESSYWAIERIGSEVSKRVTRKLYEEATSLGANAVVRLSIDVRVENNVGLTYPIYEISGFAIKRQ